MDDYKILLGAVLDNNTKGDVQKQLSAINDLSVYISKANLDPSAINEIKRQLSQNGIDLKLVFGNTSQLANQAKTTGQQIGNVISKEVSDALKKISSKEIGISFDVDKTDSDDFNRAVDDEIRKLQNAKNELTSVKYTTNTVFDDNASKFVEELTGAVFKYNTEAGEAITKTMKWAQIGNSVDNDGNVTPIKGWVQGLTSYSKSLDQATVKVDTFIQKQQQAVASARNSLSTIESKLNDKGANKTLANTDFNANGLNIQLDKVRTAITDLENANKSTFTQAKIGVESEITALNNLITTLKNAEYAATSLRTKDISTLKIDENNNLDTFVQKMEQSGHYTSELQTKVDELRKELNSVFDASTLTSYLNGLSNLQSEFKKVDATAKTSEKVTKLQTNIDAEKKILQVYTNDLKEAGILSGEVKQKIQGLFHSLSKVDSQTGLTTWRAELKGVKSETDEVLKTVTQLSNSARIKELEKIDLNIETGTYQARISTLTAQTQQWTDANGRAKISVDSLNDAYTVLQNAKSDQDKIDAAKELESAIKKTTNAVKQMKSEYATDKQVASLHQEIQRFYNENTAAYRQYGVQLKKLLAETSNVHDLSVNDLNRLKNTWTELKNEISRTGNTGLSFFDKIKSKIPNLVPYLSASATLGKTVEIARDMYTAVYDIDTAMTNLYKVTDETDEKYDEFLSSASKKAQDLGKSMSDLITQTSEWAKLGFTLDESAALARTSMIYSNVGEVDNATAVSDIVTALKAFNIEATDSITIVDSMNKLGKKYCPCLQ